jgi:Raf kinase inhibitor-like YbhB/YbcL family protein
MRVRMLCRAVVIGSILGVIFALAGCASAASGPKAAKQSADASVARKGGSLMTLGFTTAAFTPIEAASASHGKASMIPVKYATKPAGGANTSIPYAWGVASSATKSFALALVDEHPAAHSWVHWMVVDIPAGVTCLPEGASGSVRMPAGARELANTFGSRGYGGPQPPAGSGAHRYVAALYALDVASIGLNDNATLEQFQRGIESHVIGKETCSGWFAR